MEPKYKPKAKNDADVTDLQLSLSLAMQPQQTKTQRIKWQDSLLSLAVDDVFDEDAADVYIKKALSKPPIWKWKLVKTKTQIYLKTAEDEVQSPVSFR